MAKLYIDKIRFSGKGYDVYVHDGNYGISVFKQVKKHVVESAVGSDLDYLLKTKNECFAFPLLPSEIRDFNKYKES